MLLVPEIMLQKFSGIRLDLRFVASLALAASLAACGGGTTTTTAGGDTAQTGDTADADTLDSQVGLTGAGATFPAPLYQNWFVELNKKVPNLQVNYQSVGSGAGVEQFTAETVDFGASDTAMKDEEISAVKKGALMLPMTAGSIVLAYNLPGVETGLKLPRDVYVDILMGKISKWNDPKIAAANSGVTLPDLPITVVHRSDGSGTTGVFTKHLSAISPEWKSTIGDGKSVEWPKTGNFVGGKGNEGVTAQIQQTQGAIGYIEYGYAANNNLAFASLENKAGDFVTPDAQSAATTLDAVKLPENLRAFITDPEGAGSYPIVTYTWLLVNPQYEDPAKAKAIEIMVEYGLNEGQEVAGTLGYVPLPKSVREQVAAAADKISAEHSIELK